MSAKTRILRDLDRARRLVQEIEREVASFTPEPTDELVGVTEAAEILGIKPTSVVARRRRGKMPTPVAELACGPIWRRDDVELQSEAISPARYPA